MATTYKVLGQSAPSAATATTLYTVPSSTSTVVSSLVVCNRNIYPDLIRVAIRPAGAALANTQYILYDTGIANNAHQSYSLGITLAATDVVTVYSTNAYTTFSLFGSEITA
jgi:hypothetical protein